LLATAVWQLDQLRFPEAVWVDGLLTRQLKGQVPSFRRKPESSGWSWTPAFGHRLSATGLRRCDGLDCQVNRSMMPGVRFQEGPDQTMVPHHRSVVWRKWSRTFAAASCSSSPCGGATSSRRASSDCVREKCYFWRPSIAEGLSLLAASTSAAHQSDNA
jgi:hypothetical protein